MYSQLRSIEQLYNDFDECIKKSQYLKQTSNKLLLRSQRLKSISNELQMRSHQLNNFDLGTSEQFCSDLAPSVWMRGLLHSELDERLQIIKQAQSDVVKRLQIIEQLQSKVDESFQKVSRLIANRQLGMSASETSQKTSDETDLKMVLEKVYQLIDQIKIGTWAENEETTTSDAQKQSLAT